MEIKDNQAKNKIPITETFSYKKPKGASTCEMTPTKSHTHCQAALASHIQSQAKSVLSFVQADNADIEKCPTTRLTKNDLRYFTGDKDTACGNAL